MNKLVADNIYSLAPSTQADIIARALKNDREIAQLVEVLKANFPLAEMRYTHHFCEGLYARELFIPAGTLIVGKIHLWESITFMLRGEMIIFSSDVGTVRIKAPQTFLAPAGTRRVAIVLADTVVTNVLHTHSKDPIEIEAACSVDSAEELINLLEN